MRRMFRWGGLLIAIMVIFSLTLAQDEPRSPENLFQAFLADLRNDIEILADRTFPLAERPEGWTGNDDFTSDSMLADLFIDNELLADQIYGVRERPPMWIGVSSTVADLIARNIRHDLEVSANNILGEDLRPEEWVGGPLLFNCSQSTMNIIYVLEIEYGIIPQTPATVQDYCDSLRVEIVEELIPAAIGGQTIENIPELLLAVRGDLERLTDEVLGVNNRPGGWIDNTDGEDPAFIADLTTDLNSLADIILDNRRPEGWNNLISQTDNQSALLSLRFNLELLSDVALGIDNRPNGWQGETQIFRCSPIVQSLVNIVVNTYPFEPPQTAATGRDFCTIVQAAANFAIENPPPPEVLEEIAAEQFAIQFRAESRNAFTYDDSAATVYFGVLPWGTEFRAWYRNFGDSTMMFVSGEDFAVFIDRRWTTMSEETFRTLPTLEGVIPLTFCDAGWCNGPAPTPTPTGSGPLLDIINSGTQPAQPVAQVTADANVEGLQLVNWNNVRVGFLLFREDVGLAQVTLEICRESNQLVCEPVVSVFDSTTGQGVPAISQSGGLNVYQLPIGYSPRFIIEGTTLYSEDIWITDPSLLGQ